MAAVDKLLYFNVRARGEPTRMIYALADQPLEDERVTFDEWPQLKSEQPLGQLPVYTCPEGTLVLSNTIARYAAKKFGLMGDNLWEEALNDMIMETCQESFGGLGRKILRWKVLHIDPEPENPEEVVKEAYPGLLKTLGFIQKISESRGKKFIVSDKISLADVAVFVSLQHAASVYPEIMSANQWVEEFVSNFTSDERMKKYLEGRAMTIL